MRQLFDLPILLCSAASALAYVLVTKSKDENWSMFGGGGKTDITDERLEKVMEDAKRNGDIVFIKIYAEWCGFCKAMFDEWEKLSDEYPSDGKVKIYAVEGDVSKNVKNYFNFGGFPTVVLYNGKTDKKHMYDGERTVDEFKKFISKHV